MANIIHEQFHPGIKHALAANFRNWKEALLELVDNAVSDREPGRQLHISILTGPQLIEIENVGGRGMTPKDLEEMFQWGKIRNRNAWDIGAYAQGGKAALAYLGNEVDIVSSPVGSAIEYFISDQNLHDYTGTKSYEIRERVASASSGYVRITIRQIARKINSDAIGRLIAEYYRPLIEDGSASFLVNQKSISLDPFPLDPDIGKSPFRVMDESGKVIKGWLGRLQGRSGLKGGLRAYKLGRLIEDRQYFGHPDANYKQSLNLLIGEVHLDHITATTNKTGFDHDSYEWEQAQGILHGLLRPHVDDLLGRDIQEPTDEEQHRAEEVRKIVAELMKQRDKLFAGSPGTPLAVGQKAPEPTLRDGPHKQNELTGRINKPKTPPPPNAIGKRRRLNEFLEWELRPIAEGTRSLIETNSDGSNKKKLIINTLFPGYIVNKANHLYLLETAALQLCKPEEAEKMTADEYLAQFDSLFAFFCEYFDEMRDALKSKAAKKNGN